MLDLGNPLHAFDRRDIAEDTIIVAKAAAGEAFTTLDGAVHTLTPADLLIRDATRGIALAGVMGGANSEIKDDTTAIVLEAANFDGAGVRMTAQRHALRTESSTRFEKSLDPHLAETAARAFCRLVLQLCPTARVSSALCDVAAPFPAARQLTVPVATIQNKLGVALPANRIVDILSGLGFGVKADADALTIDVPSYRAAKDVGIAADIVEEVGRIYGYDNIPPMPPVCELTRPYDHSRKHLENAARDYLSGTVGMDELQTYSFGFDPLLDAIGAKPKDRLTLRNPISAEMPAMRRSIVPGLLGALQKNERNFDAIDVFEIGRVFHPAEGVSTTPAHGQRPDGQALPPQPTMVSGLVGARLESRDTDASLFFRLKAACTGLATVLDRGPLTVQPGGIADVWAHPVRQAHVLCGNQRIGLIAEVHPKTLQDLDVRHHAAVFELNLDALRAAPKQGISYQPLPRFPAVFRDFAVIVKRDMPAATVRSAITEAPADVIRQVDFQSVYTGAGIAQGEKSLAWSVTLRHDERTLTEPEVRDVEAAIWASLADKVAGRPRA